MDIKHQEASVKILACVAWADGSVSAEERAKLVELISNLGGTLDKDAVAGLIESSRAITPEILAEIKAFSFDAFGSLLVLALEIAGVDKVITAKEQEVIRQVASIHLDSEKTKKLFEWFILKKKADRLFDDVFDSAI